MWDERFASKEYVYGTDANKHFKTCLEKLEPGKILIPGEGEGRNALYAAQSGWDVFAFDGSVEGRRKALNLASENNIEYRYEISYYQDFTSDLKFDAIALIFTHLDPTHRPAFHQKMISMLNDGGHIILQGFRKEQLGLDTGGPKNLGMLYSKEELEHDFNALSEVSLFPQDDHLSEGIFHQGDARLINLFGKK